MQSGAAKNKISSRSLFLRSPLSSFLSLSLSLVLSLALFLSTVFRLSLFLDFYSPRARVPLRTLRRRGTRIPERSARARSIVGRRQSPSITVASLTSFHYEITSLGRSLPTRIVLDDVMSSRLILLSPSSPFLLVVSRDTIFFLPMCKRNVRGGLPST